MVFFFDDARKMLLRLTEPLVSDNARFVKDLTTDAAGRFQTPASSLDLQQAREIWLTYPGDAHRRPAIMRLQCPSL